MSYSRESDLTPCAVEKGINLTSSFFIQAWKDSDTGFYLKIQNNPDEFMAITDHRS